MRFGDFVAVDRVNLRIERGEIFGFLGSNGCGKTTTMKMLTGLLPASEGQALLFGKPVDPHDLQTRQRVGYMSQAFSLYSELTVWQNLDLHARLFHLPAERREPRIREMLERFGLIDEVDSLPEALPLGVRQRLSLAVAVIHAPEMLILDEPTSGVDPVARDGFWELLVQLSREDGVTIFISTHFMNEALRCDRISLMHAGRVLDSDTPQALMQARPSDPEETFIAYLRDAAAEAPPAPRSAVTASAIERPAMVASSAELDARFSLRRLLSYTRREAMELRRDPIRATLAMLGTVLLMLIMGYGISLDVEDLTYAVLDHDQTTTSQAYALNIAGSRYFVERRRWKAPPTWTGACAAATSAWPSRSRPTSAVTSARRRPKWRSGSTAPCRCAPTPSGATCKACMPVICRTWRAAPGERRPGRHRHPLPLQPGRAEPAGHGPGDDPDPADDDPGDAHRPRRGARRSWDRSPILRHPGDPPGIPARQAAALHRPGHGQLRHPGIGGGVRLRHPDQGSLLTLVIGALLYVTCATGLGLLISSVLNSQIAAIFGTAIATLLPAVQFSGLTNPVSAQEGLSAFFGQIYPTSHFLIISRGVFSKALGMADLYWYFIPLLLAIPLLTLLSVAGLRKQEK